MALQGIAGRGQDSDHINKKHSSCHDPSGRISWINITDHTHTPYPVGFE